MTRLLTMFGLWIARLGNWPPEELICRARTLCVEWQRPDLSGEFKRHQVFARLIKEFPQVEHRKLALAIELALNT